MALAVKTDIKKDLSRLHEITSDMGDFISSMQTAFIYNTSTPLQEPALRIGACRKDCEHIGKIIQEAAADNDIARPYVSVPGHLIKVLSNLQKISALIDKKITESVLFSDRAVNESIYLLQRLVEMLRPTADMILARNIFLGKYIQESQADIEKKASEYATLHENRLITGECIPAASSIYVSMLEAIKSIAWDTKEVALTLSK